MEEGTLLCNEDILGGHGSAGLLAPRGGFQDAFWHQRRSGTFTGVRILRG
jgi:hypothetical protein